MVKEQTAVERSAKAIGQRFLDAGSWQELDGLADGDRHWAAWGSSGGRPLYLLSEGTAQASGAADRIYDLAIRGGVPLVVVRSGASEAPAQARTMSGRPRSYRSLEAAGVVPRVVVALADLSGDVALEAVQADLLLLGPKVQLRIWTHEAAVSRPELDPCADGLADYAVAAPEEGAGFVRDFLSFLPSSCREPPPWIDTTAPPDPGSLLDLVPSEAHDTYDMLRALRCVVDAGALLPLRPGYAPQLITALTRIGGHSLGIVASQPLVAEGRLDAHACAKASRFVRFCDAFHLPLLFIQDGRGFREGRQIEREGVLSAALELIAAIHEATVPKIVLVAGCAYDLAFVALGGAGTRPTSVLAWPRARIALEDPAGAPGAAALSRAEVEERTSALAGARGFGVHDVIDPRETRAALIDLLSTLRPAKDRAGFKQSLTP